MSFGEALLLQFGHDMDEAGLVGLFFLAFSLILAVVVLLFTRKK